MVTVKGWDTDGINHVGVMENGTRLNITFVGKDGVARNIFVPYEAVGFMVATILAMMPEAKKARVKSGLESADQIAIGQKQMAGVKAFVFGADDAGKEFAMNLVTGDNLELRFLMDAHQAQALTTGMLATLAKHGIQVSLPNPGESRKH